MDKNFINSTLTLWKDTVRNKEVNGIPLRTEACKKLFSLFQTGDYYSPGINAVLWAMRTGSDYRGR